MKKILLAAALVVGCASAFAQATPFTGFNAAIGLSFGNSSAKLDSNLGSTSTGEDSVWGILSGEYGFAVSPKAVIGVGASIDLGDTKYGNQSALGTTVSLKAKDKYSVFVAPGYALSNNTLAFVKLGYHHAKGELGAQSESFNGFGIGLGVRTMLDKNMFLQLEATRVDYSRKDVLGGSIKPSSTFGTLSVGYHF